MQAIRVASSFDADAQMAPQYVQQVSLVLKWRKIWVFPSFPFILALHHLLNATPVVE